MYLSQPKGNEESLSVFCLGCATAQWDRGGKVNPRFYNRLRQDTLTTRLSSERPLRANNRELGSFHQQHGDEE